MQIEYTSSINCNISWQYEFEVNQALCEEKPKQLIGWLEKEGVQKGKQKLLILFTT